jgi:AraC-like DNA-binding protein
MRIRGLSPGQTSDRSSGSDGTPGFFSPQVTEARRFYLDLKPPQSEPVAVVCGGREHCAPDYHIQRKNFPYLSLEFVARGNGRLELGGEKYNLVAGTVFAYGPSIPHAISSDPDNPLVKYFLDFTGKKAAQLLASPAPRPGEIIQTSAPEHLLTLFESLIDAGLRKSPFQRRICTSIVEQMILRIAETAVPVGTIGGEAFDTYQHCRRYIETHYRNVTGLPEVAAHCHIDPAYICRLFKRYDHQSPWQYIIQLKMREAAQRLQTPGALIKNVAHELNFGDAFQFSRTFRRVFGVSPSRFVQLQRTQFDKARGTISQAAVLLHKS